MLIPMKVDYGVRTLVHLALQPGGFYSPTAEIAQAQHIPEAYLLRIVAQLHRLGFLHSRRGPAGGHQLGRPADKISVADVVSALDHSLAPVDCVDEAYDCMLSGNCSQQNMWGDIEKMLINHLSRVSIYDLAAKQKKLGGVATEVTFSTNDLKN